MSSGTLPNPEERKSLLFQKFSKMNPNDLKQLQNDIQSYVEYQALAQYEIAKTPIAETRSATLNKPFHPDYVPTYDPDDVIRLHAMGIKAGELPQPKEPTKAENWFLL